MMYSSAFLHLLYFNGTTFLSMFAQSISSAKIRVNFLAPTSDR